MHSKYGIVWDDDDIYIYICACDGTRPPYGAAALGAEHWMSYLRRVALTQAIPTDSAPTAEGMFLHGSTGWAHI